MKAGEVIDRDIGAVSRYLADHGEAGQNHEDVAYKVVQGGREAGWFKATKPIKAYPAWAIPEKPRRRLKSFCMRAIRLP